MSSELSGERHVPSSTSDKAASGYEIETMGSQFWDSQTEFPYLECEASDVGARFWIQGLCSRRGDSG